MKDKISNLKADIKKYFGVDLVGLTKCEKGFSGISYHGLLNNKPVFLKVSKPKKGLSHEKYACELAQSIGIPAPSVLHYLVNDKLEYEVLVISKVDGVELDKLKLSQKEDQEIYRNAGSMLNKMHSVQLEGFGLLSLKNDRLVGQYDSWREFMLSKRHAHEKLFEHSVVTNEQLMEIENAFELVSNQPNPVSVFMHYDFHADHIFIKDNQISGVIDFGRSGAGDARYDIAYSLYYLSDDQANSFKKGYGDLAQDPLVEKYLLSVATEKALWTLEENIEPQTGCIKNLQNILEQKN